MILLERRHFCVVELGFLRRDFGVNLGIGVTIAGFFGLGPMWFFTVMLAQGCHR